MSRAKHWTFTLNNYTDDECASLRALGNNVEYLVFGRETAPDTGTPHLQGYVAFRAALRFTTARARISPRAHLEVARSPGSVAADYCKKDGDFEEFGDTPTATQGRRTDLDRFYEWSDRFSSERGRPPSTPEVARQFPSIYTRYPRVVPICRLRFEAPPLVQGEPRQWQQDLADELLAEPDDRSVIFYVDEEGGKGKSWFVKWFYSQHRDKVQVLGIGKRDDIAHMVSINKSIFLFNVPRGQMDHFQYPILEMLKDRLVISPKYNSAVKELQTTPHVVVFCNEHPDLEKLSADRFIIREVDNSD